jgi:hypothetical protein
MNNVSNITRAELSPNRNTKVEKLLGFMVGIVSAIINWPMAFGGWNFYDDEGTMLLAFRSFAERGALYSRTYANYGPFPFALWWTMFRPFGFEYRNLAAGRIIGLLLLAFASTFIFFALRTRASKTWAAIGALAVAQTLQANFSEPFHPGAIIGLALCVALWAQLANLGEHRRAFLLGAIGAALCLTKVNVGAFFGAAWVLSHLIQHSSWGTTARTRLLVGAASIFPFLVIAGTQDVPTVLFALSVSVTTLFVCIALTQKRSTEQPLFEGSIVRVGLWALFGGGSVAAFSAGVVLFRGGSIQGLVDGIFLRAVRQRGVFSVPPHFNQPRLATFLVVVAMVATCIVWQRNQNGVSRPTLRAQVLIVATLQIVSGAIFILLPAARVAILPALALLTLNNSPLRLPPFVVFLTCAQVMHGYPVAESQLAWGTVLIPSCGVLLVAEGTRKLREEIRSPKSFMRSLLFTPIVALSLAATNVIGLPLWNTPAAWAAYRSSVPLDETHATFVRLPAYQVKVLRGVRDSLEKNCSVFYSLPGMGTFNALADLPIATGYNGTIWTALFDDQDQKRVLNELQKTEGLCILRSERTLRFWTSMPLPGSPLLRYVDQFTKKVTDIDGYIVYVRPDYGERNRVTTAVSP